MSNRAGFPGTPQWAFDPDQFPERTLEDWHRPVTLPPPANGNGRAHRGEYQARGNPGYNMPTQPGFGPQAIQRAGNARLPELHEQFDQQLQIGQRRDLNRGRTAHRDHDHRHDHDHHHDLDDSDDDYHHDHGHDHGHGHHHGHGHQRGRALHRDHDHHHGHDHHHDHDHHRHHGHGHHRAPPQFDGRTPHGIIPAPGGHGYVIIQDGAPPRFVDTPQEYGQAPQGYSMTQPRPRGRGHDNYGPY
ncbi:unnamed protein product [Fusarium langsethiae]|nr:unnamed protein product [Fusarium langsethiae]